MTTLLDIIQALFVKTRMQRIDWEMNGQHEIYSRFGRNIVEVDTGEISSEKYGLFVRDKDGNIIEGQRFAEDSDPGRMLAHIFQAGSRRALGVDKILDDILGEIKNL